MFLFIFESIGTSELLLIGVVSLIFLGPRRMPEMAKKIGKFMSEFRGTANEFKETWRREVDLENTAREFDLSNIEAEVNAEKSVAQQSATAPPAAAEIKEVDPQKLEELKLAVEKSAQTEAKAAAAANDKKNWL
ncbi:MAG: twin-arginine translocase subunit TatB [Acidobacteria bacterium]|nr:twin-arginine translocase subunit TatB [Acidobacteriota bacterium]